MSNKELWDKLHVVMDGDQLVCIYINGYRILGRKPYASKSLNWIEREVDREEIAVALQEPPFYVEQNNNRRPKPNKNPVT